MEPLWCSQEQFIDMKETQIKSNYIGSAGALCVSTILCLPRCVYILYLQIVCFSFIFNKACSLFLRFFLETRRIFWSLPVHHVSLSARSTLFWNFHDFHVPVFLTLASFFFLCLLSQTQALNLLVLSCIDISLLLLYTSDACTDST